MDTVIRSISCLPKSVTAGAISSTGRYAATINGDDGVVELSAVTLDANAAGGHQRAPQVLVGPGIANVSQVAFRDFLARGQMALTELLFCREHHSRLIERWDLATEEMAAPILTSLNEVNLMRTSHDGRYVVAADTEGGVEIYNLDREPELCYSGRHQAAGRIRDVALHRGNHELFAAGEAGRIYRIDWQRDWWSSIHGRSRDWDCYSIATQPDDDGVAFAGEGRVVWFLRMPYRLEVEQTCKQSYPFDITNKVTDRGRIVQTLPYMDDVFVQSMRTKAALPGSFIKALRFITDRHIAVLGDRGLEIWNLLGPEAAPALEQGKYHVSDSERVLSFGGDKHQLTWLVPAAA